jgi:dienelactone hydrolase
MLGKPRKTDLRTPSLVRAALISSAAAIAALFLLLPVASAAAPLTLSDVLDFERIEQVAVSPDHEWVAAVVQRPARPGEVYGRTFYDLDPGRSDIWLLSRRTGERRNLTAGAAAAAGFWCPVWSPDGSRLLMLSTRPEGDEPRGGDNVRLYIWDRRSGALVRLSADAAMTQTPGGSAMYRLDLRSGGATAAQRCSENENAPFLWLDERRILAAVLPEGSVSGLLDLHSRPMRHSARTLGALRAGREPTATASASGDARRQPRAEGGSALLKIFDAATRQGAIVAPVPIYPFRGELTVSVAPDRRKAAVMTTLGAIEPARGKRIPHRDDSWSVVKKLGFVDLRAGAPLRWARAGPAARYPLDLFGWSPDSARVALRARADGADAATPLFVASYGDIGVLPAGGATLSVGGAEAGAAYPGERPVHWLDARRLLARGAPEGEPARSDWWLVGSAGRPVNLTRRTAEPPANLFRSARGRFFGLSGGALVGLNIGARRLEPVAVSLAEGAAVVWPRDPASATGRLVVAGQASDGRLLFQEVALDGRRPAAGRSFALPAGAQLLELEPEAGGAFWRHPTRRGLFLKETSLANGATRDLLSLNGHLASVDWGESRLIDYRTADGRKLAAAVILPPGYRERRRSPALAWIYPGYVVSGPDDYFLDPYMGGFYNLHLYAAQGFVVVIPSIPLNREGEGSDLLKDIPTGVLPAIDRLAELGIADADRVGLFGQSFGGYGVYALVTQSRRFKAAVAMAGISDLTSFYTQFDATARGYPGIEHEKSYNWSIAEARPLSLDVPPYADYQRYWRNSPIAFVDKVETPLLLIHGEHDARAPMAQAESFFYSLYRQGKTARLLRYWGENHGLSQSPANIQDIFDETIRWFRTYLTDGSGAPAPAAAPGPPAMPPPRPEGEAGASDRKSGGQGL